MAAALDLFTARRDRARLRCRHRPTPWLGASTVPRRHLPLDYGFLEGTSSGDGQAIDVFVGTAVGAGVCGVAVIADPLKRDSEIKVLLDCAPGEVEVARAFLVDLGVGVALLPRPTSTP